MGLFDDYSSAGQGVAVLGSAGLGGAGQCSAWHGLFDDLARLGPARHGQAWQRSAGRGAAVHGMGSNRKIIR